MTSTPRSAVALRDSLSLSLRPPLLGRRREESSKTFSGPKIFRGGSLRAPRGKGRDLAPRSATRPPTLPRRALGPSPPPAAGSFPRRAVRRLRPLYYSPPARGSFPPRVVRFLRPSSVPPLRFDSFGDLLVDCLHLVRSSPRVSRRAAPTFNVSFVAVSVKEKKNDWHAPRVSRLVSLPLARRVSRRSLRTSPSSPAGVWISRRPSASASTD